MKLEPRRPIPRRFLLGWILFVIGVFAIVGGLFRDGGVWLVIGLLLTSVGIQMILSRSNREASRQAAGILGKLRRNEDSAEPISD